MQQKHWLSWAFVAVLVLLCAFLAILQNHWINALSSAERDRLRSNLQAELNHLSFEFNDEMSKDCSALMPSNAEVDRLGREQAYSERYWQWKDGHGRVFTRIAIAVPHEDSIELLRLDLETSRFSPSEWPAQWAGMQRQLLGRLSGVFEPPQRADDSLLVEIPRFGRPPRPDGAPGPPRGGEQDWLLLEFNLDYIRESLLPSLLQRHLAGSGKLDYDAEVVEAFGPPNVIYHSTPAPDDSIVRAPDASVNLFAIDRMRFRRGPGGPRPRGGPPPPAPESAGFGRWRLAVRHRAGSLEAVVARARWHNLAASLGTLLLLFATAAALVRYSRQTHRLAELQMNFIAGVSHELRTPLTVIRTAAFNLRGRVAAKPEQVEKYATLIQDESEKLTSLLEQILRFASAEAGKVIRATEPVKLENIIDDALRSSTAALAASEVVVEKHIDRDVPLVLADAVAIRHALQNLIENALKYGTGTSRWIGVFLSAAPDGSAAELRVSDRGPGIPHEEQEHIFDAFYRGRRAVEDQVRGTGLGLNLVKRIVEAHGGAISVHSEPMAGTDFILRLPAAPPEMQHEFAHSAG